MENQKTDEIVFEGLSEKEVKEVNQIYRRFIKKYKESKDKETKVWLYEQIKQELPDISDKEAERMSEDITESIQKYNEDYTDLNKKMKHGITKEKWMSDRITEATKGMSVNLVGQQLDEINNVLEMGNRQMERVVMNMDGSISQNPCLDGYMAEQYHVNSFNAKAVLEGSPHRARVCEPDGAYGKNSVDIAIDNINLAMCRPYKDFGQGFYLTTSKEQAESFLRTSIAKAIATGTIEEGQKFGYISTFEFNLSGNLETHIYENADVDWLHCIAAHRKKKMFIEVEREMARYDIIAGKIADDATNATLTAYLAGAFGTAGDKEADDFCIRQLLPNKLKDQYCFKTEAAIKCLKFVKGEKIWLK